jgi:hypothetical protein
MFLRNVGWLSTDDIPEDSTLRDHASYTFRANMETFIKTERALGQSLVIWKADLR